MRYTRKHAKADIAGLQAQIDELRYLIQQTNGELAAVRDATDRELKVIGRVLAGQPDQA